MLKHFTIHNYALSADVELELQDGFTVLTGETGAGKSILLGALALVMGAKADTRTLTEGEDKCVIEATFAERDGEIIVRRELSRNGRSRSFVNDEVASMTELKALSTRLIDIHSQHQNLLLADSGFQTDVVDAIAKNADERTAYTAAYEQYLSATAALDDLQRQLKQLEIEREAIKREDDREKIAQLDKDIAELKEKEHAFRARWQGEKQHADEVQQLIANEVNDPLHTVLKYDSVR